MNLQAAKETIYQSDFQTDLDNSAQPEWLKNLRREAFAYFTEHGLPTVKNEDWKYTDVKAVAGKQWPIANRSGKPAQADIDGVLQETGEVNRVVFVDGIFDRDLTNLSQLPEGARILGFREAVEDSAFRANFANFVEYDFNGFTALNTAFAGEGVFIHLAKNAKVETPIHILFVSTSDKASFPRVLIVAESFAEATIIEGYRRTDELAYLTNAVVELSLADEAKLKHFRVQRESLDGFHIGTTKAELGRGSVYDATSINLGGRLSRHDIGVEFTAEGGEAFVDGLYMLSGDQHADTHSLIEHNVPNCTSHQNYKGVMNDRSRAVFNGKVYVAEGATGTDAFQSNKNLLLSNDARVDTKPQLEIYNDDVKCAHGATVGQLEEEELFYLLSRGLNEDLARNLLTYGFAEEVINKIEIESIKKQLDESVLSRLHAELEA